ncbi:MAG: DUF4105 domain-containing protein [Bacteriovoracia bacterium]
MSRPKRIAWILLLLAPLSAAAAPFAQSPEWLNLLHFRPSFIGPKSTADGRDFFLSPEGKVDPEKELAATLAAFRAGASAPRVGALKQIPLCAFPARRHFLERALGEKFPGVPCPEFEEWRAGLSAEKATYVFSSAYPNNPAAMFGHTLLRLDRAASAARTNLLNYGVAFSANIPTGIDDFRYGLYGLLGGFAGVFSLAPYYTMVNDYTNAEIRDLWEYPLKLNPAQVATIVEHLWELYTNTYFDYYFFTENCTTQLLALLQVALPEIDIFRGLPIYILPIDSIHQLKKLGLIEDPLHRPSVKKKLTASYATLSKEEKKEFATLVAGKIPVATITSSAILDTAAAYWNYKKFLNKNLVNSAEQAELTKILLRRATLGKQEPRKLEYSTDSRPDLGHYSSAANFGYGYREKENRVRLGYRIGVHDLLDGQLGFEPNAQIDIFSGSLAYLPERKKIRFEELRLFEVTSLFPWDNYDRKLSWKISARAEEIKKVPCDNCHRGVFEGGAGISFYGFGAKDLWYSLLTARSAYSSRVQWDLGLGSESGLLFRFSPRHSARFEARGEWDFFRSFGQSWSWNFSFTEAYTFNQRWELRAGVEYIPRTVLDEKSAFAKAIYFF